jgi:hypothetical protein
MALAVGLKTGALLGTLIGASVGGIKGAILDRKPIKNMVVCAIAGLVAGVALAVLGHYAGQAALIGGGIGLLWSSALVIAADTAPTRAIFFAAMVTLLGATVGYSLGLLNASTL